MQIQFDTPSDLSSSATRALVRHHLVALMAALYQLGGPDARAWRAFFEEVIGQLERAQERAQDDEAECPGRSEDLSAPESPHIETTPIEAPTHAGPPIVPEADDPGSATVDDTSLGTTDDFGDGTGELDGPAVPESESGPDPSELLVREYHRLARTDAAREFLGEPVDLSGTLETMWCTAHRACLRLPKPTAVEWRAAFAGAVGIETDPRLPDVPPLGDSGGVILSEAGQAPNSVQHDRVRDKLGARAGEFAVVAAVVGDVLTLLDNGENEDVEYLAAREGERPMSQAYTLYRSILETRLEALSGSAAATETLGPLIDIDEYIRSVVHNPLPAPDSWWNETVHRLARLVQDTAEAAGCRVESLTGVYTSCKHLTDTSKNRSRPGQHNQVLRALRVAYWNKDSQLERGRVLYGR